MAEGSSLDLAGRGNAITMLGDSDLEASDKGQRVEVYGNDNHVAVNGSTVIEHGLADADIDGSLNTVRNTPVRPDLLKKELESEAKTEQLMNTLWDQYEKISSVSISQQWRQLQPDPLPSELAPAIYDNGLNNNSFSSISTSLLAAGNNGLTPQPLLAANSPTYGARVLS